MTPATALARLMPRLWFAAAVLTGSGVIKAQSLLPATPPGRAMQGFLESYNGGDVAAMGRFIAANPGFRTSGAARFLDLHRTYGVLDPVWVEASDSLRLTVWTRGRTTGAAVGFVLQVQARRPEFIDWLGIDIRALPPAPMRRAPIIDEGALNKEVQRWAAANAGRFSGVVGLSRAGRTVARVALGTRTPDGPAITGEDAFLLASVSKVFVGLGAARLVASGQLRWDALIGDYLAEFPAARIAEITLRDLLTHRSGLEFDDDSIFRRRMASAASLPDMIRAQVEALGRVRPDSVIGPLREPNYSNEGYVAAARILEVVAGLPFDRYLADVLAPTIGLRRTALFRPPPSEPFAPPWTGRRLSDGAAIPGPLRLATPLGLGAPSGDIVATTNDLHRLGEAILEGTVLPAATWQEVLADGFGFDVERDETGLPVRLGHSGNNFGVSAEFWVFPRTGYVLSVLANREGIARAAFQYFNELVPRN